MPAPPGTAASWAAEGVSGRRQVTPRWTAEPESGMRPVLRRPAAFTEQAFPARAGVRRQHASRGAERSGSSARPGRPLTWHSKPSRPWWSSAPSRGAARPRCRCRPGPRSAGLPWLRGKRSVARPPAAGSPRPGTHSGFNRAPRAPHARACAPRRPGPLSARAAESEARTFASAGAKEGGASGERRGKRGATHTAARLEVKAGERPRAPEAGPSS